VSSDPRFAADVAHATSYLPRAIISAPLLDADGEVLGVIEVLDPQARDTHAGRDLSVLGAIASQLAAIVRLSALYDALGAGLLKTLADPEGIGLFDDAIAGLSTSETPLDTLAKSFRDLARQGPDAVRLAQRILNDVAAFIEASS
jgi:GAF domain-containing protein